MISICNKSIYSSLDLLQMHIDAMFTLDEHGNLAMQNEPWGMTKAAPILFFGKTVDGDLLYRHSADETKILGKEHMSIQAIEHTVFLNETNKVEEAICYANVPNKAFSGNCAILNKDTIGKYNLGDFEWLSEEIAYAQPCAIYIEDGEVISVCRSVRIGKFAHEAGIETAKNHRQKGYAKQVLFAWANAVCAAGAVPLYSHAAENKASQRLAESAGLQKYATTYSVDVK